MIGRLHEPLQLVDPANVAVSDVGGDIAVAETVRPVAIPKLSELRQDSGPATKPPTTLHTTMRTTALERSTPPLTE